MRSMLALELGVFLFTVFVTYFIFRKLIFGTWNERMLGACLLSAPAMLPQFARLEGHVDAILYIALLLACYAISRWPGWTGLLLSTALSLVAMLQHEAYLLLFYPALCILALTQVARGRMRFSAVVANFILLVAGFFLIVHYGHLKISVDQAFHEATARTDVPLDRGVFAVMNNTAKDQWRDNVSVFRRLATLPSFFVSLMLAIPYFALLQLLFKRALQSMDERWGWLRALILPILVSPMILVIAGSDLGRWVSACCIDATLVLFFWYRFSPIGSPLRVSLQKVAGEPWFAAIFVYLLALGPFDIQALKVADVLTKFLLSMKHVA